MSFTTIVAAGVAALGLAGAALAQDGLDDPNSKPYYEKMAGKTVAFIPLAMGFDLAEGWAAGLSEELEPLGINFEIKNPNWDTTVGAQALTALISEKPEVIIVHNPDVQSYARLCSALKKQGFTSSGQYAFELFNGGVCRCR